MLETNTYDVLTGVHPCLTGQSFPTRPPSTLNLYDTSCYIILHRGHVTKSESMGGTACHWYDRVGMAYVNTDNSEDTSVTLDSTKNYAVPSLITPNGYSTSMQWDGLLNLTNTTGPNSNTSTFGYDALKRPASTQGMDGESATFSYSFPSRYSMSTTGKKFAKATLDGLGRTFRVETGYNPTPGTSVVESVVDTEYAPCACTPTGKMWRMSQPKSGALDGEYVRRAGPGVDGDAAKFGCDDV